MKFGGAPALVEPWPAQELVVSGRIVEEDGSMVSMLFYRDRTLPGSKETERVLQVRLIMKRADYERMTREAESRVASLFKAAHLKN